MSKSLSLFAAALFGILATAPAAIIFTGIDNFTTAQTIIASNETQSSTVASAGAIGGYRTLTLTDTGDGEVTSSLNVSAINNRVNLSSAAGSTTSFSVLWGGLNGTAGLGGVDMVGGNLDLTQSTIELGLRSADFPSNFTWLFTDTSNNVASYTGSFPSHTTVSPVLAYSVLLSSFANAGSVDWTSINFIELQGGGVLELDLQIVTPLGIETTQAAPIPEPGTWAAAALLVGGAALMRWRRRQTA